MQMARICMLQSAYSLWTVFQKVSCLDGFSRQEHVISKLVSFAANQKQRNMKTNFPLSDTLEQVHENLLRLTRLLERAGVKPRPQVAPDWVDGQEVMKALHISRRTLQTLRDNGTLGYAMLGQKIYYRISEVEELLRNNYVMYKLKARGKEEPAGGGKGGTR